MPEGKKSLTDLIRERLIVLLTADDLFIKDIQKAELSIWELIRKSFLNLSMSGGRIIRDTGSNQVLLNLRRNLLNILGKSKVRENVLDFLPRFDQVEKLQGQIYGRLFPALGPLPNSAVAKRMAVERIVGSLGELKGLDLNYVQPLVQRMFFAVETQMKSSEAMALMRDYVVGTSPSGGQLSRYSRQITMDLLNGYDGYIQQKLQQKFNFDAWFYTGSLIKDSRPNCQHLVRGDQWFEYFAIKPGFYAVNDIPAIVNIAAMPSHSNGWRPETTAETFPIYRCGFNCRHALLFTDLTAREENALLQRIQQEMAKDEAMAIPV